MAYEDDAVPADAMKRPGRRQFVTRSAAVAGALPFLGLDAEPAHAQQTAELPRSGQRFEFGIMGDMPYTRKQEAEYERVIADLNARELAFAVHIGDAMFDPRPYERNPDLAREPGSDENYRYVLGTFESCRHPLVFTPGDNDWSDYVEFQKVKAEPFACLAKVRETYFRPGRTLGQRTMPVTSQRDDPKHQDYVENLAWSAGGVGFVSLHLLGSNDNFQRSPELEAERLRRQAANLAWLRSAFQRARDEKSLGLAIMIHANPGFENHWPASYLSRYFRLFDGMKAPNPPKPTPYDEYIKALAAEMESYDRPTALFHGDTHLFRIDKPLFSAKSKRLFENFTRVETFGWPDSHWVRVTVDPANPQLFSFTPQMVQGNRMNHLG